MKHTIKRALVLFIALFIALLLATPMYVLAERPVAMSEGSSLYTVEFTYNNLEYVMKGDTSVVLSEITQKLGLTGEVEAVSVSKPELFSASNENGELIVIAHKAFSTAEWMKVTINGVVYKITVTDTQVDPINYIYYEVSESGIPTEHTDGSCMEYATVTDQTTWGETNQTKWYVVNSDVTISNRITITGTVHLILADGYTLTASNGIDVSDGNNLIIYSQSKLEDTMGKLIANAADYDAGIGSSGNNNAGNIIISGGNITSNGGKGAAGIGSGYKGEAGSITIYEGMITATGGRKGAGIGGGCHEAGTGEGGTITICGGTINSYGGVAGGAAIGGGYNGAGTGKNGSITINAGTINATDGEDAGIGGGYNGAGTGEGGSITISGGIVNATGGEYSAGIGGGNGGNGGNIIITGGQITASGGPTTIYYGGGAGIGGGNKGNGGKIKITGGVVTANGICGSSGIGGGYLGAGTGEKESISISGGTITANGGIRGSTLGGGAGIGGGGNAAGTGNDGSICICGGTVEATGEGAGIGGGGGENKLGIGTGINGSIIITDGHVTAVSTVIGASIGGGQGSAGTGEGGTIAIRGGTVIASARIGGGSGGAGTGEGGTISISGGTVIADAGIGGGDRGAGTGEGGTISISGGTIKAAGDGSSAGIGGNPGTGKNGSIVITGGQITATGGYAHSVSQYYDYEYGGAGIGGSSGSSGTGEGGTITISGGIIEANGGGDIGAGIGGGNDGSGGNIIITGGQITAIGDASTDYYPGFGGAGIGSGYSCSDGNITLAYSTAGDSITASGYSGTVTIANGIYFSADGLYYSGNISNKLSAIAGKTLIPTNIPIESNTGGKVVSNTIYANKGETVILNVTPETGYLLDSLNIINNDGTNDATLYPDQDATNASRYAFTMPEGTVIVTAIFVRDISFDTWIAVSATAATYNGTDQATTVTVIDKKTAEETILSSDCYDVTYPTDGCVNVGTYELTVTGKGDWGGTTTVDYSISKRPVTISVSEESKTYGESDPMFADASMTGQVTGELEEVSLAVSRSDSDNDTLGKHEGVLSISATKEQLEAEYTNYTFTVNPGDFTVNENETGLTVSAENIIVTYDGQAHGVTASANLSDAVVQYWNEQSESYDLSTSPTWTDCTDGEKAVRFTATLYGYKDATGEATVSIDKREVTVAVNTATNVEYDGDEHIGEATYSFSNVVPDQTASISYTPAKGTIVGTYTGSYGTDFKVVAADSTDTTANYILTETPGNLTVTDRATKYSITVKANSNTGNVYDGTQKNATGFESLSFVVNGHNYTVSGLSTSNPSSINECNEPNTISGTAVVKDENDNDVTAQFDVNVMNGSLQIGKRSVTISIADGNKTYGESDPAFADASMTGQVTGELSGILLEVSRTDSDNDTLGKHKGVLSISTTKEQLEAKYTNYAFTVNPGDFTINENETGLTVSAENVIVAYDGQPHGISASANLPNAVIWYWNEQSGEYDLHTSPTWTDYTNGAKTVKYKATLYGYKDAIGEATVTLEKASNEPTVTITGWTYGEMANEPCVSGNLGGGTVTFLYAPFEGNAYSQTVPVNAGEWQVKASIAESANSVAIETTPVKFTIARATATVSPMPQGAPR